MALNFNNHFEVGPETIVTTLVSVTSRYCVFNYIMYVGPND